jgi:hypothetical protein
VYLHKRKKKILFVQKVMAIVQKVVFEVQEGIGEFSKSFGVCFGEHNTHVRRSPETMPNVGNETTEETQGFVDDPALAEAKFFM